MNVIVSNEKHNELANLDVDIIKSLTGTYSINELVSLFNNFFYSKMILDVTALNEYDKIGTYEVLVSGLNPEKIIFLLPEGSQLCTPNFLSQLISLGIYNFTTNLNGIKYLLKKTNTLKDVEHITKMAHIESSKDAGTVVVNAPVAEKNNNLDNGSNSGAVSINTNTTTGNNGGNKVIIGVRNVTEHAGASTFIFMLRKELVFSCGQDGVIAIEVNDSDFQLFGNKYMVSCSESDIRKCIDSYSNAKIIFVDLNDCKDDSFCTDIFYLIEPSTIKLNKLIRRSRDIFSKLNNKKIILNKSLLLNNDVFDFEGEAGIKTFYNMPPLDDRKRNAIITDFLTKAELIGNNKNNSSSGKIFGLFRR